MSDNAQDLSLDALPLNTAQGFRLNDRLVGLLSPYGGAPAAEFWPEILRSNLRQEALLVEIRDALTAKPTRTRRASTKK